MSDRTFVLATFWTLLFSGLACLFYGTHLGDAGRELFGAGGGLITGAMGVLGTANKTISVPKPPDQ